MKQNKTQLALDLRETGAEKKARILDMYRSRDPRFVEECQRLARHYIHSNYVGMKWYGVPNTVTADDLWEYLGTERERSGRNRIMGSVFARGFARVGTTKSRIDDHNSYEIKLWTLPEYAANARRIARDQEDQAAIERAA